MKKQKIWSISVIVLSLLIILAGCGSSKTPNNSSSPTTSASPTDSAKKISAVFFVNGVLGDKGFLDSANAGMLQAGKELGIDVKTVEAGVNQADWQAGLESLVSSKKYDVVVIGSAEVTDIVKDLAARYPNEKFIFFDQPIKDIPNIYSMTYSQSEGSFLAGAFAALVTESTELKAANPEKIIGFVGGMDIPVINDFKTGYEQGAKYIDPSVQIITSYIGDWANAPKGKELALAQYNQKADIIYQVAGGAGLGVLEAGSSVAKYTIGVDVDQNVLYPGSVLTSMQKNISASLVRAFDLYQKGTLPFGTSENLGLKETGVGLSKDDLYKSNVPQAIQDKMTEIEGKLASGVIKVKSIL
jgi:basic membrane protein A